jgi:tRNA A-37 threonylcarbamoyl transferase component Bud32
MADWEAFYREFRRADFIPGYEIQHHLGRGAFGEVYKARKTSIGKPYAIKFLRLDEEATREAVERELEYVRLFAAIDHPHLVTIEDMGVALGVQYLILGYAGEDTLARRIKRRDLDRAHARRYFVQACRGVLALHDRRLAHFDLKPGNIFLRGEVARVGDYGLAKLLTEGRSTLSFGRGTPHYMAPEQFKNRGDQRSDVYSLGVILFESLAFRLPYGEGAQASLVRERDAAPDYPDDFPADFRGVVERCLRVDPAERFASVHELLEALGEPARQGDSVRMRFEDIEPEARRLSAAARAADPALAEEGSELRATAAELARGAIGVARGVWDGMRERVSGAEPPPPSGAASSAGAAPPSSPAPSAGAPLVPARQPLTGPPVFGGDVVSVSTLEEPDEPTERDLADAAVRSLDKPWRAEIARYHERGGALAPAAATAGLSETVPVPPRVEGGWIESLMQSIVVGAEIMGALITGPVLFVLRRVAGFCDRALRGVPRFLSGSLRLTMLLVSLALLGGFVALLLLALISFGPWIGT